MLVKTIDYGERLFFILLSAPFLLAFAVSLPTHPNFILVAVSEILAVVLIIIRKPGQMATAPYPVAIALVGTALPLMARPGGMALVPLPVGTAIMAGGLLLSIAAKLALNRSFGLVAANRGIKVRGPYHLVRHPMYLGYIVTEAGFLLVNFYPALLALYAVAWTAQALRAVEEERILLSDRDYVAFASGTRWRMVPGLF